VIAVVEQLVAFVGLDDGDRARLAGLHARLAPELRAIVDRFYDALLAQPAAAAVIRDDAQLQRMHAALVDWLDSGLAGPHDAAFHARRARLARHHFAIGLPAHYVCTAMTVIRDEYDQRVARLYPPDEARRVMRSVHKLLDLELALMLCHDELDAEPGERERRIESQRVAAIQTLSAGLAHEVRNPLNAAKLQLELLERRLRRDNADAKLVEPVELAHHEIERLTGMLTEFLAFARPAELNLDDHDIAAIAREVIAAERPLADRRGATIAAPNGEPVIAKVDRGKLQQILHNLLRNAIEAVSRGGHVAIAVRGDDACVRIEVSDDGPGIPDAVRHRIYEPFFTTKDGGTGLGMAIVHSMVTLHGGTIDVASSPRGTRFEVVMPRSGAAPVG